MSSRLDKIAMYGAGEIWDHRMVPQANKFLLLTVLLNCKIHRSTISEKIQETINEITFVYYLEGGSSRCVP